MTNEGAADLVGRIETLKRGRAHKPATDLEKVARAFALAPTYRGAMDLLVEIGKQGGVRTHRPGGVKGVHEGPLQLCHGTEGLSFADAAIDIREQNRLVGRPLHNEVTRSGSSPFHRDRAE
jgi:hypothetical protein